MATIPEALAIAIQHHQGGRLQAAEQIYRRILEADPANAKAYYLLGAACQGLGKLDEAEARRTLRMLDQLDENDDVQEVYANFDISDEVMEALEE